MRALLIFIFLCLLAVFSMITRCEHQRDHVTHLESLASEALGSYACQDCKVEIDHLDAKPSGIVESLEIRDKIASKITAVQGLRLREQDNGLRVRSHYTFAKKGGVFAMNGELPEYFEIDDKRQRAVEILRGLKDNFPTLDYKNVTIHPAVISDKTLPELNSAAYQDWMRKFFDAPGTRTLTANSGHVLLTGEGTNTWLRNWMKSLRKLVPSDTKITQRMRLVASEYHLGDYKRSSKLSDEDYLKIKEQLRDLQIYFDSGSAKIKLEEELKLPRLANLIMQNADEASFVIGGHTDVTGSQRLNRLLSQRRARAVAKALISQGVDKKSVELVSFGATQSVEDKNISKEEQLRLSRRVETLVK